MKTLKRIADQSPLKVSQFVTHYSVVYRISIVRMR
jgi:hypothetical protein